MAPTDQPQKLITFALQEVLAKMYKDVTGYWIRLQDLHYIQANDELLHA